MKRAAGLWVDHRKAVIVVVTNKGKEIANRRFKDITAEDMFSVPGEAICSLVRDRGN